jgi:drug/metabolite transporter (DMT)-like permease
LSGASGYAGVPLSVFGERYGLLTWLGAVIIVAGVFLTTSAQAKA